MVVGRRSLDDGTPRRAPVLQVPICGLHLDRNRLISNARKCKQFARLAQTNVATVVRGPRQSQQVTLTLSRPQRQHHRQRHFGGRAGEEGSHVFVTPDLVSPVGRVKAAATFTGIRCDQSPILAERKNTRKSRPGVICFSRGIRKPVAPTLELPTGPTVRERCQGKSPKSRSISLM
jgi:hypothetical protein